MSVAPRRPPIPQGWTPLVGVLALAAVENPVMSLFLGVFAERRAG